MYSNSSSVPWPMLSSVVVFTFIASTGQTLSADTVVGEFSFRPNFSLEFLDMPLLPEDVIRIEFAYDSEAEAMPVPDRFKNVQTEFPYNRFFDASYEMDFLRVVLPDQVIELEAPILSVTDSEFAGEECMGDLCFPVNLHRDNFTVAGANEEFSVLVGGDPGGADTMALRDMIPTSKDAFLRDLLAVRLFPGPTRFGTTGNGFQLSVVPEPSFSSATLLVAALFTGFFRTRSRLVK